MRILKPLIYLVFAGLMPARAEPAIAPAQSADAASEVVNRHIEISRKRQAAMRGMELEVDIHARVANLNRWSRLRTIRRISCNGKISYQSLDSSGDNGIKKDIIARYLAADRDANDNGAVAVDKFNYEFRLKPTSAFAASELINVFQLRPRKKRVGLFKGEIRLDASTGMPVQESGRFVKIPPGLSKASALYENMRISMASWSQCSFIPPSIPVSAFAPNSPSSLNTPLAGNAPNVVVAKLHLLVKRQLSRAARVL